MVLILARRPNPYTGNPLDRAVHRREDAEWVAAALADPASLFLPVWQAKSLLRGAESGRPEAVFLPASVGTSFCAPDGTGQFPWAFLGLMGGRAVFAFDLGTEDPAILPGGTEGEFTDLRAVPGLLPPTEAAMLAHARGLIYWRTRTKFCGVCGTAVLPASAGHVMRCPNCGTQHFPRTDPAVIMLVHDGKRALLGHSHRFPRAKMYSTLAGFVEPGESLEEAVAREVLEETSVRVGRVDYHSSQPWPFPGQIMLGFYAEALSEEITIDPEELRDARWFTRDEIAAHESLGFNLPRLDSIARRLIEDWMANG
ncbi:MAG TPA: NAD(+) diphosphatase [Acetobacteraceae bacterium]|nr:NAD(+) diphosphatase [Acetobacteraceae bacterium]